MFGRFYEQHDAAVAAMTQGRRITPESYACALLSELLDRARTLAIARSCADRDDGDQSLASAVDVFLLDVDEARTRGLRARLFCRTPDGRLDPWSIDPNDTLADVGGELVTAGSTCDGRRHER